LFERADLAASGDADSMLQPSISPRRASWLADWPAFCFCCCCCLSFTHAGSLPRHLIGAESKALAALSLEWPLGWPELFPFGRVQFGRSVAHCHLALTSSLPARGVNPNRSRGLRASEQRYSLETLPASKWLRPALIQGKLKIPRLVLHDRWASRAKAERRPHKQASSGAQTDKSWTSKQRAVSSK